MTLLSFISIYSSRYSGTPDIHCVAQLLLTPEIVCLRSAQLNLQTYILIQRKCLVFDHHSYAGAALYSPNGFHKLSVIEPATLNYLREQALQQRSQLDLLTGLSNCPFPTYNGFTQLNR